MSQKRRIIDTKEKTFGALGLRIVEIVLLFSSYSCFVLAQPQIHREREDEKRRMEIARLEKRCNVLSYLTVTYEQL